MIILLELKEPSFLLNVEFVGLSNKTVNTQHSETVTGV